MEDLPDVRLACYCRITSLGKS